MTARVIGLGMRVGCGLNFETVKAWLEKSNQKQIRNCRLMGVLALVLAPVALALACTLVFGIVFVFANHRNGTADKATCLWISLAVIPLMFVGNYFSPKRNLMEERMENGPSFKTSRPMVQMQFFLWIMFAGPRLINWAMDSFRRAKRLQQQDSHSCAAIIWVLLSRGKKVSYEDLQTEIPWLNMETAIAEVRLIDGVVTLQTPPPGLSLTQDFRDAFRNEMLA